MLLSGWKGADGSKVGLDNLRDLFQPKWSCDSLIHIQSILNLYRSVRGVWGLVYWRRHCKKSRVLFSFHSDLFNWHRSKSSWEKPFVQRCAAVKYLRSGDFSVRIRNFSETACVRVLLQPLPQGLHSPDGTGPGKLLPRWKHQGNR